MKLGEHEPEVALAVRIPGLSSPVPSSPSPSVFVPSKETTDESENGDIDSTLLSYGFEYVDATRSLARDSEGLREFENDGEYDVFL